MPPLLRMVWETSRALCIATLALRLVAALLPLAMLWIPKLIIDLVVRVIRHQAADISQGMEALIGSSCFWQFVSDALARFISLVDSLLGDKFTNHVSIRLMRHATSLDLVSFEDPVFYDKLERARRQTTARLGMLATLAWMAQQSVTLLTLISAVVLYSPWLLVLLLASTIPVLLGETRFALLNYSILFRYTPERRELDYLRYLGASNESSKEVKIFGLGDYLTRRAQALFDRFYDENKAMATHRAVHGTLLGLVPTTAYYGAYAYIVWQALQAKLSVGDLTLMVGAFSRARTITEGLLSRLVGFAEQALFIKDLFDFFETTPSIVSPPARDPRSQADSRWVRI